MDLFCRFVVRTTNSKNSFENQQHTVKGKKVAGRTKGTPNKESVSVKTVREIWSNAFHQMQNGINNLHDWGEENPTEFYKLSVKLIPLELTGVGGEALFKAFNGIDTDRV